MARKQYTLEEIAQQAMAEHGFIADFSEEVLAEIQALKAPHPAYPHTADLRDRLWVSIDNDDSLDLDQLTYAEKDRFFVAVADVDGLVKKGSAIDRQAAHNTTSIYTPSLIFPMLPVKLSNDLTSLNENADRTAIVTEIKVSPTGYFELVNIYPAFVRNRAKLAYPSLGDWLEGKSTEEPFPPLAGLREQLQLQNRLTVQIQNYRDQNGALKFADTELRAEVVNGTVVSLREKTSNLAQQLIENGMIAANVAATAFLKKHKSPTIQRVVKKPKRWERIVKIAKDLGEILPPTPDAKALRAFLLKQRQAAPLLFPDLSLAIIKLLGRGEYMVGLPTHDAPGHFDLAETAYTHSTAPNRRYPDVIMQRLLKSCLFQTGTPYTVKELEALAAHCSEKEADAQRVERRLIKCAAAVLLEKEVGKVFEAMVTGAAQKGTWVRLLEPRIEGKLTKEFKGVDVGDFIQVKLLRVDTYNGHIDFARVIPPKSKR